MKTYKILFISLLGLMSIQIFAQGNTATHDIEVGVPAVALLSVEGGSSIDLKATAPSSAGLEVDLTSTNTDLWINYSSIINSSNTSRSISVHVSNGTIPSGISINLVAGTDQGQGQGTEGDPTSAVTLTTTDQDIITGIGSVYTGNGTGNGHNLTYSAEVSNSGADYSDLDADQNNTTLTVTYTLSDE